MTGRTVDAAKEEALDQLGVAEADAELIVVSEPKTGLFGRVRGEARVRARVRPVGPRPKRQRRAPRDRDRSGGSRSPAGERRGGRSGAGRGAGSGEGRGGGGGRSRGGRGGGAAAGAGGAAAGGDGPAPRAGAAVAVAGGREPGSGSGAGGNGGTGSGSRSSRRRRRGGSGTARAQGESSGTGRGDDGRQEPVAKEETEMAEGMTLEEQAVVAREFLEGLLDELGFEGSVETRVLDEETVELAADGEGLGLLVGPKGSTLAALQDVTRTVVQRRFPSRTDRILVDVAGYRERRATALQRFSQQVAAEVVESGTERVLEPMSPADRKVVHDTVNSIDGVATRSEGEDPARYIVISPAG